MPQLVKGGKHVFGWSLVGAAGRIVIPPEAYVEYGFAGSERLIVRPSSRSSRGFVLGSPQVLRQTVLGLVLDECPSLGTFTIPEGATVRYKGKPYCWVTLDDAGVTIPPPTLAEYGVVTGGRLAVIRGSGLALSFLAEGPIVEEARRHPELEVFGAEAYTGEGKADGPS